MEIKKRLILTGSSVVNAVLLYDEGEEYPVFLESLHNTIIFPTLIESGYKLTELPYGFIKNGVTFDQLPVENYSCTDVQTELMYNSIGVKLPYDELKKHIDVKEVQGRNLPPVNYTIHTREELLQYLDATAVANSDEDFKPLNYFVAPEARFSLEEYKNTDNHKYVSLINKRREMSLVKFYKLVDWLLTVNLKPNYTAMDVLDAYFAWGMDGLDYTCISSRRESRAFMLSPNRNVTSPVKRRTQGFVDGMGNLLTPPDERDVVWQLPSKDPTYVTDLTRGMQMNDTKVVEFQCMAKQDVTILEGTEYNIQYTTDMLLMQRQTYTPIRVKSPVEIGRFIDLKLALPTAKEKLYEHCMLLALARMLYDKRKPQVKVSSYDALRTCGANPKTALDYIVTKFDLAKERKMTTEEDAPRITYPEIEMYLQGEDVSEAAKSFLSDCISGVFNIDNIANGKQAESLISIDSVFNELYAIHNVMGISLEEIYKRFTEITPDMKWLVFSNGEYQHSVEVSQLRFSINGYLSDVQDYDLQNSRDCSFFTYVTMIAREVGVPECRRHVGIEFLLVSKNKKQVREVLEQLENMYEEKVVTTIPDATKQARLLRHKHMFALSRFFEAGLKGTITWTKDLGDVTVPAMPSMSQICKAHMENKIENLTTYCSFTTNSVSASNLTFNAYCVNAYITPEYVIPRGKSPIREVAFFAAWNDWAHTNPAVLGQLVDLGVLPAGWRSWSERYLEEQFVQRDMADFDNIDSLQYYSDNANQEIFVYPDNIEFTSVTHPIDYMFPGLAVTEDETDKVMPVPRQGQPVIRIGVFRDITIDDYRDKLYPSTAVEVADQYIRPFRGYDAEAFIIKENIFEVLPKEDGIPLTVMQASESVYVSDTKQVMNFRRLVELDTNKYPIVNVYGRIYLVRTADGRLWEAKI